MVVTWDDDYDISDDESSSDEDELLHAIRPLATIIELPNIEEDSCSDEDEDAEVIQEAFNKLYLVSIELAKANSKLKKKRKIWLQSLLIHSHNYLFIPLKICTCGQVIEATSVFFHGHVSLSKSSLHGLFYVFLNSQ